MLEVYEAYGDYDTIAELTRELIQEAALAVFGSLRWPTTTGRGYDLSGDWPVRYPARPLSEALGAAASTRLPRWSSCADLQALGIEEDPAWVAGMLSRSSSSMSSRPP